MDVNRPTGDRDEDVDGGFCSRKVTRGQQHSIVQPIGGDVCFLIFQEYSFVFLFVCINECNALGVQIVE